MSLPDATQRDRRVLVLAPRGRDAAVIHQVLEAHGLDAFTCHDLPGFLTALREGAGLAFVTEEALAGEPLRRLTAWVAEQPPWSDFPLTVLATKQAGRRSEQALATLAGLGNMVLLERPLNADTLVSAARSGLRARARQYQTREHLDVQLRIGQENERLYQAERLALREAAEVREALSQSLAAERSAREEAEYASRMKDEFLATLSHELRTPLSAILGWVHLLRRRKDDPVETARGIDTIERNARSQARLIEELLDMSRIIAGNVQLDLQRVMPATIVDAVVASLQPSIDAKSIRIEAAVDAGAGPVSADANRLQQIVSNLLSNAIKFTPAGGLIRVELLRETGGAGVVLRVADNGDGIAADFLPFVFDRFRQADGSSTRSHGGLGLGLAIVRQLVELHGGSVAVASDGLGHGASFVVRLPAGASPGAHGAAPAALPDASTPSNTLASELAGLHIVLVDDDADGREMIARLLADAGASVDAAGSADEATEKIHRATPDIVISDIGMPRVDGYQLMQQLRGEGLRMPSIALTAFARPEERSRAMAAGYSAHLAKPVEPSLLVSSVLRLTGRAH